MRRLHTPLAAVIAFGFLLPSLLQAEPIGPRVEDQKIALVLRILIQRDHIAKPKFDDEISGRIMKAYVNGYDPLKLYFLKSDVDKFLTREKQLDDQLKKKRLDFAYEVYRKFVERIAERVKVAEELLKGEFKFDKDEDFVTDGDAYDYAKSADELRDRWRKRIKYDLLQLKADKTTGKEARDNLRKRYGTFLTQTKRMSDDELLERFLTSVTNSFDPHTSYFSPSTLKDFRIRLGLNYQGIGAELQSKDGAAIIRRIIPGGAADKQKELKKGDRIMKVGQGDEGEMIDVSNWKLNEIIDKIRGKEGTIVRLGVSREGVDGLKQIKITRARIKLADSAAKGEVIENGKKENGDPLKVGVVTLPSFYIDMEAARRSRESGNYTSTSRDVRQILDRFRQQKVDVVLLDLRNNGGGSLPEAIRTTGLFIDEGPVVQVKDSRGRTEHYDDRDEGMAWDGPLVVAVNKFSASASEILAGAIQDYRRGLIVGDPTTHGKGTVQSLMELGPRLFRLEEPPNLGALKITIQQFYRPDGDSTQRRGVVSDIVLPSLSDSVSDGEADLDYALTFDRITPVRHDRYKMVNDDIKKKLTDASKARRKKSKGFVELLKSIAAYKKRKERKATPLLESKFNAQKKQIEDQRKRLEDLQDDTESKKDFFFQELAAIASDYYRALGGRRAKLQ